MRHLLYCGQVDCGIASVPKDPLFLSSWVGLQIYKEYFNILIVALFLTAESISALFLLDTDALSISCKTIAIIDRISRYIVL